MTVIHLDVLFFERQLGFDYPQPCREDVEALAAACGGLLYLNHQGFPFIMLGYAVPSPLTQKRLATYPCRSTSGRSRLFTPPPPCPARPDDENGMVEVEHLDIGILSPSGSHMVVALLAT